MSLLLVNYVVAVIFGWSLVFRSIGISGLHDTGSMPWMALINGVLYVSAFLSLQLNIKVNGATVSASMSHMGLIIPVLFSILLFGEYPSSLQAFGVAVAIASLAVISFPSKGDAEGLTGLRWLLVPMLLLNGMADMMSKIFEAFCDHVFEDAFLSTTFTVALIICIAVYFLSHEKMNRYDFLCGIVLGVVNYMSTKFLIRAIYAIPAYMAYITYGLGVVVFINLVNMLILHEKLTSRDYIGMVLSMGAIVLLNL